MRQDKWMFVSFGPFHVRCSVNNNPIDLHIDLYVCRSLPFRVTKLFLFIVVGKFMKPSTAYLT